MEYTSKVLYNILLEKHDQMMVHNNLIVVETLHPDNTIAKLAVLTKNILDDEEQASAVKTGSYSLAFSNLIVLHMIHSKSSVFIVATFDWTFVKSVLNRIQLLP